MYIHYHKPGNDILMHTEIPPTLDSRRGGREELHEGRLVSAPQGAQLLRVRRPTAPIVHIQRQGAAVLIETVLGRQRSMDCY